MTPIIYLKHAFCKTWLITFSLLLFTGMQAFCSDTTFAYPPKNKDHKGLIIGEYLQVFYPLGDNEEYSITVCADLPVNNKPEFVYKKGEPGHVFLILSKKDIITGKTITRSFGFYPRVAVTCLFKQSKSKIRDNSNRQYDAALERKLSKEEFKGILDKCRDDAKKKYNLKKYNCYDYVLQVFNSLPGIEKLPLSKVKFPFIFGKGGSPCGLYNDLKKLTANSSAWSSSIRFGYFHSPDRESMQDLFASW
ncbi:MAG: hypothetical protein ABIR18_00745 [Chitinophagaceae bacterium]